MGKGYGNTDEYIKYFLKRRTVIKNLDYFQGFIIFYTTSHVSIFRTSVLIPPSPPPPHFLETLLARVLNDY